MPVCAGAENWPEGEGSGWLDATEFQRGFADLMQTGHAVDPAVVPGRCVHRHQQVGGSAAQEFVGEGFALAIPEGLWLH